MWLKGKAQDLAIQHKTDDLSIAAECLNTRKVASPCCTQEPLSNTQEYHVHSATYTLDSSVPQGLVLRPIKFITYTEDIAELFHCHELHYIVTSMPMTNKSRMMYVSVRLMFPTAPA